MSVLVGWVKVGMCSEILLGEYKVVWDGDIVIVVYNIDGIFYVVEDVCIYDGVELVGGDVYGFEVECVCYGVCFDL